MKGIWPMTCGAQSATMKIKEGSEKCAVKADKNTSILMVF
jgi:hypothetical protein